MRSLCKLNISQAKLPLKAGANELTELQILFLRQMALNDF
ncbi:hypothetical protein AM1_F0025 (plasmid) [Acaryochloris marina MBIC11017]|uniref:Uncharacterized protein n=1 Tax=Acaryochloris marina (strain MBIC 11017) TaxID=329726 RepID=A8ZQ07_ACAM1|nr:hypothetical protein AM1_F0025 [Acaryochloris marina MBIC11017]